MWSVVINENFYPIVKEISRLISCGIIKSKDNINAMKIKCLCKSMGIRMMLNEVYICMNLTA
jgi:hypothetical protein